MIALTNRKTSYRYQPFDQAILSQRFFTDRDVKKICRWYPSLVAAHIGGPVRAGTGKQSTLIYHRSLGKIRERSDPDSLIGGPVGNGRLFPYCSSRERFEPPTIMRWAFNTVWLEAGAKLLRELGHPGRVSRYTCDCDDFKLELNLTPPELPAFAPWLAAWIESATLGRPAPPPPRQLSSEWNPDNSYLWTAEAANQYDAWRTRKQRRVNA